MRQDLPEGEVSGVLLDPPSKMPGPGQEPAGALLAGWVVSAIRGPAGGQGVGLGHQLQEGVRLPLLPGIRVLCNPRALLLQVD